MNPSNKRHRADFVSIDRAKAIEEQCQLVDKKVHITVSCAKTRNTPSVVNANLEQLTGCAFKEKKYETGIMYSYDDEALLTKLCPKETGCTTAWVSSQLYSQSAITTYFCRSNKDFPSGKTIEQVNEDDSYINSQSRIADFPTKKVEDFTSGDRIQLSDHPDTKIFELCKPFIFSSVLDKKTFYYYFIEMERRLSPDFSHLGLEEKSTYTCIEQFVSCFM